jgi:hypothetical protein
LPLFTSSIYFSPSQKQDENVQKKKKKSRIKMFIFHLMRRKRKKKKKNLFSSLKSSYAYLENIVFLVSQIYYCSSKIPNANIFCFILYFCFFTVNSFRNGTILYPKKIEVEKESIEFLLLVLNQSGLKLQKLYHL